jgi:hypothetical protein
MVAVSHRHHLLNTLARCNRLHLVRPSLTGDRLATAVTKKRDLPTNIAAALSTSIKHSEISPAPGEVLRRF